MKKIFIVLVLFGLWSCDNENSGDCFQTAGKTIQQEVEVPTFNKILIHEKIELIISESETQKVVIETGENLLNDISWEVLNNELILRNNNSCNFLRDYGITKVYVTSPNITRIRNASELSVTSNGVLTFPSLYLMSVGKKAEYLAVGDFNITVNNENLKVWSNGVANIYVKGTTYNLNVNLSDGNTRFEGKELIANNVTVKQVSSNDIVINPTESLKGSIHSVGNVISYNKPSVVEVDEQGVGKLIFK